MRRYLIIAGFMLNSVADAATAKLITVGPALCPFAADAEPYTTPPNAIAEDARPRIALEKSLVVLKDVRLGATSNGRAFVRIAIDPETGGFLGVEPAGSDCKLVN
jgi:hypothetical protein